MLQEGKRREAIDLIDKYFGLPQYELPLRLPGLLHDQCVPAVRRHDKA